MKYSDFKLLVANRLFLLTLYQLSFYDTADTAMARGHTVAGFELYQGLPTTLGGRGRAEECRATSNSK